jgi:hypothetical protein
LKVLLIWLPFTNSSITLDLIVYSYGGFFIIFVVFPVGCRHFSEANLNAIDQTWYKRAVDQYSVEPDSFVYSVPFSTGTGM